MAFAATITFFIILLYIVQKYYHRFWERLGFPQERPVLIFGNIGKMITFKESVTEVFDKIYYKNKENRFVGFYGFYKPSLLIIDTELVHNILIRDFSHFHDHSIAFDVVYDPLLGNLFSLTGQKWRDLRVKLTPTFTSGKLRMMYPVIKNCGEILQKHIEKNIEEGTPVLAIKDLFARFSTLINSSVAFGIENDCINNKDDVFYNKGIKFFDNSPRNIFRGLLFTFFPSAMKTFGIKFSPKETEDFIFDLVKEVVEYREKNNIERKDFMDLLIQLKNKGYVAVDKELEEGEEVLESPSEGKLQKLTMNELTAQAFVFFLANFETSSATMTFCLYEIIKNPAILRKVQEEIDQTFATQGVTFDSIKSLKYLDCCLAETTRKYPPVPLILRRCSTDYPIPGTKLVIPKDTEVQIPVFSIQRDPNIFENPLEFNPDRFWDSPVGNGSGKGLCFLPFGEGPRHCIGMRMAKLNLKIGISLMLAKFSFELVDKKLYNEEIQFNKKQFPLMPADDILLKAIPR